jgi:hypothetical protein
MKRSCSDPLRLHSTFGSSSAALGFPAGFRCPSECPLCHRTAVAYPRRGNELSQVRHFFFGCMFAEFNLIFSPMRLLRTFPPLEALPVIGIAVTLVRDLPPALYDELVKHPYEIQTPL